MPLPVSMDATWLDGSVSFNAQELRRADSALFYGEGSAGLGVQGGIARHSDTSLAVTVNASDVVTVQPGAVVIPGNFGTGNGVYRTALASAETGTLTARNATNPRIDLVVFRVLDTSVVAGHGAYTGRIEIIAGTPAASPVAPSLPTLAVELARITVPIAGGAAATVDSSFRQFSAALGGILPVATATRLPSTPNPKWVRAVAIDTGREYIWNGTAWVLLNSPGGVLGFAQLAADVTGLSATAAPGTDVAGLSVAVTVGAGRRLRLSVDLGVAHSTVGSVTFISFYEGSTLLFVRGLHMGAANTLGFSGSMALAPTAGAHTYKVAIHTTGGTVTLRGPSVGASYFMVEDIGAV